MWSHLSTLGHTPNILLEKYRKSFVWKLRNLWILQIWWETPPDDFLLFPDIHGLLLSSVRPGNPESTDFQEILRAEYSAYRVNGASHTLNSEELIPDTNIVLTLDFHNPDVEKHTHPDHQNNQVGITFGIKSPEEWRDLFARAFNILSQVSPGFMTEIDAMIRKIIPFDVSYRVHNSGSYSDVIGHLLMSYPTGIDGPELVLLEAILHEYNHNKINLIMQTETLILSDRRELYYSPYRPDARHIHGIYLGLHAIAWAYWVIWNAHISGVISLSDNWKEKAALYVLKNWLSLQVLDTYGSFSPLGREILEEMRAVHRECLDMIKKSQISPSIVGNAKTDLISHFQSVKQLYPWLQF